MQEQKEEYRMRAKAIREQRQKEWEAKNRAYTESQVQQGNGAPTPWRKAKTTYELHGPVRVVNNTRINRNKLTPYGLFAAQRRIHYAGQGLTPNASHRLVMKDWSSLSTTERKTWEARAQQYNLKRGAGGPQVARRGARGGGQSRGGGRVSLPSGISVSRVEPQPSTSRLPPGVSVTKVDNDSTGRGQQERRRKPLPLPETTLTMPRTRATVTSRGAATPATSYRGHFDVKHRDQPQMYGSQKRSPNDAYPVQRAPAKKFKLQTPNLGKPIEAKRLGTKNRLCRLCAVSFPQNGPMYALNVRPTLVQHVRQVLGVALNLEGDEANGLPAAVCRRCYTDTLAAVGLRKRATEGTAKLERILALRRKNVAQGAAGSAASTTVSSQAADEPGVSPPHPHPSDSLETLIVTEVDEEDENEDTMHFEVVKDEHIFLNGVEGANSLHERPEGMNDDDPLDMLLVGEGHSLKDGEGIGVLGDEDDAGRTPDAEEHDGIVMEENAIVDEKEGEEGIALDGKEEGEYVFSTTGGQDVDSGNDEESENGVETPILASDATGINGTTENEDDIANDHLEGAENAPSMVLGEENAELVATTQTERDVNQHNHGHGHPAAQLQVQPIQLEQPIVRDDNVTEAGKVSEDNLASSSTLELGLEENFEDGNGENELYSWSNNAE